MALFVTDGGETVEAFEAMADLYRRRGWTEVEPEPETPTAPSPSASRKAWADYAESLGYEVEDMTKAQIIEALAALD